MEAVQSYSLRMLRELAFLPLWKYVAISTLIASVPFLLIQHAIMEIILWMMSAVTGWFDVELASPISMGAAFLLGSFLFTAVSPFLGHFFLPLLAIVQVFFIARYLREYAEEFLPGKISMRISFARDILIVVKWTILKWLLFILLHPLHHIPLVGLSLSVTISMLWFLAIYIEIVLRSASVNESRRSFIKSQGTQLFWISISGMAIVYVLLAFVGVASVAVPPIRVPITVAITAILMAGGLMSASELLEIASAHQRQNR